MVKVAIIGRGIGLSVALFIGGRLVNKGDIAITGPIDFDAALFREAFSGSISATKSEACTGRKSDRKRNRKNRWR